jgi:citrate synthase
VSAFEETSQPLLLSETVDDVILVRGRNLATEVIGVMTFTEAFLFLLRGTPPTVGEVRVADAILVSVMEHGLTPSALTARLVFDAAPEALQGAVSAGLLASGSRFLGAMREAAQLNEEIVAAAVGTALHSAARELAAAKLESGERLPGFGHNLHERADPRVLSLFAVARREGIYASHCEAQEALAKAVAEVRPNLVANAAGTIGAIVLDLGFSPDDARGFALVARSAGLVAHVRDESVRPVARTIWESTH